MIGYHYCSLDAFLNILKNKEIYLSDPLKMNDRLEISWHLKKLEDDYKKNAFDSIFERMKIRSRLNFSIKDLLDILDSKGQKSIYISCFSEKADLLSQWRAYADDGKGISIGFDLDKLQTSDNILIEKVIYRKSIVEDETENDVERVADTIRTIIEEKNITDPKKQIEIFLHELISELAKYKNLSFKEEKEIRLIYCDDMKFEKIVNSYNAFREPWSEKRLKHHFRTIRGGSDITEYVKLDFSPNFITNICIGPKCLLNKNDVLNISSKLLGTKPIIKVSKSSYR